MADSLVCPKCDYENIVLSCGFCLQCGADIAIAEQGGETEAAEQQSSVNPIRQGMVQHLDRTIRLIARQANYAIRSTDERWRIQVSLSDGRSQNVLLSVGEQDDDGEEMLRFLSMCGAATDKNALPLLKMSGRSPYCAFAVRKVGTQDAFVVTGTLPAGSAGRESIGKMLLSVASRADQVEKRIRTGGDRY